MSQKAMRKVHSVRGSFYIYLPKTWCSAFNITKDTQLPILELPDGTLLLQPPEETHQKELRKVLELSLKDPEDKNELERLKNFLLASYIVGADDILIQTKGRFTFKALEAIKEAIEPLHAFEVLNETENCIHISAISAVSSSIPPIIKRMLSSFNLMLNDAIKWLENPDEVDVKVIFTREDDLDKFRYLLEREAHAILTNPVESSNAGMNPAETLHYVEMAKAIERMGDHLSMFIEQLKNQSQLLTNDQQEAIVSFLMKDVALVKEVFQDVELIFNKMSTTKAFHIIQQQEKIRKNLFFHHYESKWEIVYYHLRRIVDLCADVAELLINQKIYHKIILVTTNSNDVFECIDQDNKSKNFE